MESACQDHQHLHVVKYTDQYTFCWLYPQCLAQVTTLSLKTLNWLPVTTLGSFIGYWRHISNFNPKFTLNYKFLCPTANSVSHDDVIQQLKFNISKIELDPHPTPTLGCVPLVFQISVNGNSILLLDQNLVVTFDSFLSHIICPIHQQLLQTLLKNTVTSATSHPYLTIFCWDYFNSLLTSLQSSTLLTLWPVPFKTQTISRLYNGFHLMQNQVLSPYHGLQGSIQPDLIYCSSLGSLCFRHNTLITSPWTH